METRALVGGVVLYFVYACSSTASSTPGGGEAGTGSGKAGSQAVGGRGGASAGQGGMTARAGAAGAAPEAGSGGGEDTPEAGEGGEAGAGPTAGGTAGMPGGAGRGGGGGSGGNTPQAGAGGQPGCMEDVDCENPHRGTCTMKCNDAVCEARPASTLSTAIQSGPRDAAPRTGFWTSNGTAYLAYPTIGSTPTSIVLQALDSDGALQGTPPSFFLPAATTAVDALAAGFRDNRLGLLWHGTTANAQVTEFAVTNVMGAASTPMLLNDHDITSIYPDIPLTFLVHPLPSNRWATVVHSGRGAKWLGYVATPGMPPSMPPFVTMSLPGAPYSVAARASVFPTPQAAVVIDQSLFVTGYDCEWSGGGLCEPVLIFDRFGVTTMARLGEEPTTLSTTSYPMEDRRQRTPVIAQLGNRLAAFWTQYSGDTLQLGRAVFQPNGTIATMRTVQASDLIPKALVQSPDGGGLLIALQVGSQAMPQFTLVARRVDAELNFISEAYALSAASSEEPTEVQLIPSGDGRALLTFRRGYAQHRILHTGLCQ